jgi:hypothetical protein
VVKDIVKPYKLIKRQKVPHKKVNKVVGYLQKTYRWTVPTFVKNYVTAKHSSGNNSETYKKHTEKLLAVIFNNLVIEEVLFQVKNTKLLKL